MFRKLILATSVTAATLIGLTGTPSTADAGGVPAILPHNRFEVLATRGGEWKSHGIYNLHVRAEVGAARLRLEGYRVEIRQF